MLLPFYIIRYEKMANMIEEDQQKFTELLNEYEDIRKKLEEEI